MSRARKKGSRAASSADSGAREAKAHEDVVDQQQVDETTNAPQERPRGLPRIGVEEPRKGRREEWIALAEAHFRAEGIEDPHGTAVAALADEIERIVSQPYAKSQMRWLEKTLPALKRKGVLEEVEIAAAMRKAPLVWLFNRMQRWGMGCPAFRSQPAAALLDMGFTQGRPVTRWVRAKFLKGDPALRYAYGEVVGSLNVDGDIATGSSESAFYDSVRFMTERHSTRPLVHINLDFLRQLAELKDEDGEILFNDLAVIGAADGKDVEADVPQRPPRGKPHKEWIQEQMRRRGMAIADWRSYGPDNEKHWKELWGWKIVVLTCLKSGLALGWVLIPANGDEREALREILAMVFDAWPSCPIRYVVGDSFFDHSKTLAYDLRFRMGITPCFHKHGKYSEALPYCDGISGQDGVPHCKHGPMKQVKVDARSSLTAAQRIKRGQDAERMRDLLARGEADPTAENCAIAEFRLPMEGPVRDDMRICFACNAQDPNDRCAAGEVTTFPRDDARVYTELPRDGLGTKPYAKRVALQTRRLASESINALMTHRGMAGRGPERKAKGTDAQVDWLMSLGLLWMTARALIHADGSYAETRREMFAHGLINGADSTVDIRYDEVLRKKVRRALAPEAGTPPRGWLDDPDVVGYNRELRPFGHGRRRDRRAEAA